MSVKRVVGSDLQWSRVMLRCDCCMTSRVLLRSDAIWCNAQGLVELAVARPDPVLESSLVQLLLKLLQALLAHGQLTQGRAAQQTWAAMLPQRQASAYDVLQVSSQLQAWSDLLNAWHL